MQLTKYEQTLNQFPHWYDKNPYSNFSRVNKVLHNQELDKHHKIRTLDFAKRLIKPIQIWKEQDEPYIYHIRGKILIDNIQSVNFYINPLIDDKENITYYEQKINQKFTEDEYNKFFIFDYVGDTRKQYSQIEEVEWDEYDKNLTPNRTKECINFQKDNTTYWCKKTELLKEIPIDDYYTVNVDDETYYVLKDNCATSNQVTYLNYDDNKYYYKKKNINIIPYDTFIIEVITYDDYRWVKGFPENDNNELYKIYQEKHSYTNYLTFNIKKQNIKNIQILKNDELLLDDTVFEKIISEKNNIIKKHTYIPSKRTSQKKDNVLINDLDNDEFYKYQIILYEDDYDENGNLKDNYDLIVTLYDKSNPNCDNREYVVQKRYNGYDKTNYDCFSHDYSLDMIGHYWNVPRLSFIKTNYNIDCRLGRTYYENTMTPYDNRLTEDDYHYQERMREYISKYNNVHFPVLELWKNYGVWSELFNRKDIISKMGTSYLCEKDYGFNYETIEYIGNKLDLIEGIGNYVSITTKEKDTNGNILIDEETGEPILKKYEWYESVILTELFVIPETRYRLKYILKTDAPLEEYTEQPKIHIYYYDKKGNCHHQEIIDPTLQPTGTPNSYITVTVTEQQDEYETVEKTTEGITFTTPQNACKMDIVLEYDYPFNYNNAYLDRVKVITTEPLFMMTPNDYNSCIYELKANYDDFPSNIDFSNTNAFDKLLQRSLPLTHKGFLNIKMEDNDEKLKIRENVQGELLNYFNNNNNYDDGDDYYSKTVNRFIKTGYHYTLKVTFHNDEIRTDCETTEEDNHYIIPKITYRIDMFETGDIIEELDKVQCNNQTTLIYHFTVPSYKTRDEDTGVISEVPMRMLTLSFESDYPFSYSDLTLRRKEPLCMEELWRNI